MSYIFLIQTTNNVERKYSIVFSVLKINLTLFLSEFLFQYEIYTFHWHIHPLFLYFLYTVLCACTIWFILFHCHNNYTGWYRIQCTVQQFLEMKLILD